MINRIMNRLRATHLNFEDFFKVCIVPACAFDPALNTAFVGWFEAGQI